MMPIEHIYSIPGRGTVISGRVDRGKVKVGDKLCIAGGSSGGREAVVIGTQAFHKDIEVADAGLNVGLLLRGVDREEISRGQVAIAPGSLQAHLAGAAEIFVLSADDGGRHTSFGTGYSPQFFFGASDVSAVLDVGALGAVNPGDRATVDFTLGEATAFEPGMRFAIREGGKTVGAGVVLEAR